MENSTNACRRIYNFHMWHNLDLDKCATVRNFGSDKIPGENSAIVRITSHHFVAEMVHGKW